jgi:hypothetical protein
MKPNFRNIRVLPIFSNVQLLRHSKNKQLPSTRSFWQRGLLVGPSIDVPAAYQIAVNTRNKIKIVVSTVIKGISDGGD